MSRSGAASKRRSRTEKQPGSDLLGLAEALLVRHLQESWPSKESVVNWFRNGGPPPRYDERIRTVAIVGAGASIPMLSAAGDLAKILEDEIDNDREAREIELDRLENVYGLHRNSFETRLTAVCRTEEQERKVRQEISKRYRHYHPSLLTYELLAHLLHHRYLDTIISYNFDELLDQSIEDEMGTNEYTKVVTERDCDPNAKIESPLYIKMHGTAAEPDSLRFTRERYYTTPSSIVELVEQQFDIDHLVLINLGFTMASFDFQHLLRKPKHLEIFHLDPVPLKGDVIRAIKQQREKARERKETSRSEGYDEPAVIPFSNNGKESDAGLTFLEDLLGEVVEKLEALCNSPASGPARWRSTLRHRAAVKLLKDSDIHSDAQYTNYLRRRTVLEIAFAAAKGRGVVSIASMINDRCGRYYDLYARIARKTGIRPDTWPMLCRAGGLIESPGFPDTYEVLPDVRGETTLTGNGVPKIHTLRLADPAKLAAYTAKSLDISGQDKKNLTRLLTRTLEYLQKETEIEVHSRDDRVCSKLFAKPEILKTLTALQGWTREMLRSDLKDDELWLVSETGDWLAEDDVATILKEHYKEVKLLSAFDANFKLHGTELKQRRLPWGRHNRHMTIVCNKEKPRAAIYFVRRLRAATVTPVYLANQGDLKRVATAFKQLWGEAEAYEREWRRD